jgi:hypothetical protein
MCHVQQLIMIGLCLMRGGKSKPGLFSLFYLRQKIKNICIYKENVFMPFPGLHALNPNLHLLYM